MIGFGYGEVKNQICPAAALSVAGRIKIKKPILSALLFTAFLKIIPFTARRQNHADKPIFDFQAAILTHNDS